MQLDQIRTEIERMRTQVQRQRGEIRQLQRAGISTTSAEALLERMLNGNDRLCAERPMANAPFPIPAHQTGRADFRHPAFRLASPQGTRRQTNRTRLRHGE